MSFQSVPRLLCIFSRIFSQLSHHNFFRHILIKVTRRSEKCLANRNVVIFSIFLVLQLYSSLILIWSEFPRQLDGARVDVEVVRLRCYIDWEKVTGNL